MTQGGSHWAESYIGMPWTPQENCWYFCAQVWAEVFGIAVPLVEIDGADARAARRAFASSAQEAGWYLVTTPAEGDAVLMAQGARPCHVGIWLNLGGVLHSIEQSGVVFTASHRLGDLGYRILGFYRRGGL